MESNILDQYQILDSGNFQKLEQVGDYRFIRPSLNAFWPTTLSQKEWESADAIFQRNSSGGGKWNWKIKIPNEWIVTYNSIRFIIKLTNFGHLGFFPEQKENWDWLRNVISTYDGIKAINLFAYSGGSSIAMAQAGAKVCHVDAAKGMVEWAKTNLSNNKEVKTSIRWIIDDVTKFLIREANRKEKYDGIVLDPPSFGRGPNGQVWKIENDIVSLLERCKQILSKKPKFILLSLHSHGFSDNTLKRVLQFVFGEKILVECGGMTITESTGKKIDAGSYARLLFN